MAFRIDDEYLPATLTSRLMSDEEFITFCNQYPDLFFEMTAEGDLVVMAPRDCLTGARNANVAAELHNWSRQDRSGFCADSSTGWVLPNGARRSPDASWTAKDRVRGMDLRTFLHLCPDFVVEIKSDADRLPALRSKMREYMENGVRLGWLIDPASRTIEVYRLDGDVMTHTGVQQLEGEGPVLGFVLDLTYVWDPMAG